MEAVLEAIVSTRSPFSEYRSVIEIHEVISIKIKGALARMIKIENAHHKFLEMYLITDQFDVGVTEEVIT